MSPPDPNARRLEPEALADLASGVAHEIRNPVNTISLTSQVLQKLFERKGLDLEEFREYFRVIHFELGKIKKIIDNFVKFSRVPDLDLEATPLDEVLAGLSESVADEVREKGLRLDLPAAPPKVRVLADRVHLTEAFLHLLQNSIQSTPEGGTLRILVVDGEGDCGILFQDDGPGIDLADPDRIFNPYYSTTPGGLGLGLTLSRSIIESHGGTIRARSRPEGGAEFEVRLPQALDEGDESDDG